MAKPISDEELQLKVRARHRLIGAITLVVAMIVVIPMVFDSTPRKEKSEISIQIPAPDNPPPFNPKFESSSKAEKPVIRAPVDVRPPSAGQPANSVAKSATDLVMPLLPPAAVTEQPVSVEKNSTAGQPEEAGPATEVATAKPARADKFVVQLGVFANPDNAKQVEEKLKENDIHYYTEVLKSPAGAVRVRAGPFDSRGDAEEARTKLKLAGLSGGVVIGE
jgi:DedD protein